MQNTNTQPAEFTEIGCYLDNHRGHYISRDVIDFAEFYGFKLSEDDARIRDDYEEHNSDEDYPFEALIEICDEAIEFLNSDKAPKRPEGAYWSFEDGDFGLWVYDEDGEIVWQ